MCCFPLPGKPSKPPGNTNYSAILRATCGLGCAFRSPPPPHVYALILYRPFGSALPQLAGCHCILFYSRSRAFRAESGNINLLSPRNRTHAFRKPGRSYASYCMYCVQTPPSLEDDKTHLSHTKQKHILQKSLWSSSSASTNVFWRQRTSDNNSSALGGWVCFFCRT